MVLKNENGCFYLEFAEGERLNARHFKMTPTKYGDMKVEMAFYLKDVDMEAIQSTSVPDGWEPGEEWGEGT